MTGWSYPQRRPHAWDAPKLTAEQRREIIDRYGEGESAVSLAAEFGVSASAVRGIVPARTSRVVRTKLTARQREEITRRYHAGETADALAAEYGVSTRYVSELAGARGDTRLSE